MKDKRILIFLDFVAVITGMLLGYAIRFSWAIFPYKGIPPVAPYLQISIFSAIVWVIILSVNRIYQYQTFLNFCFELSKIIQASFYSTIIITGVTFFYRGFSYSRIAISTGIVIAFLLVTIIHLIFVRILSQRETVFLLSGNERDLESLVKRLKLHGTKQINIRFYEPEKLVSFIKNLKPSQINQICVIACLDDLGKIQIIEQVCSSSGIRYFIYPKASQIFLGGGRVEEIDGIPVITTQILPLDLWHNRAMKRFFDIFLSIIFLTMLLPFLIIVAITIKITSTGPIFFVQERIGYKNRKFRILKFRTMIQGAENILPYTLDNDPRITKIGKLLRKFHLDELPQFFNVLKSDMSIVGPRPISIEDRAFFTIPGFHQRMRILPGMTGWAQIHGLKGGQVEPEERFRYDIYYAENWSIWLDFAIIVCTIFLFSGKNTQGI